MALSGTFYTNVGARWRLQVEWTATQNISANTSSVTAKLYWMGLDQYSAVYSSASGTASVSINGSTGTSSHNAALSAGQKKLLHTRTVTVTHDSDGGKSTTINTFFDAEVTLAGTYYGRIHCNGNITLNTIPRESTLTTSPSWTAGNNTTISISRASTSFRHEVDIYVKNRSGSWVFIKQRDFSTSQTSLSSAFSTADVTAIFDVLDGRASADTRLVVDTYNGSTFVGSTNREGTVTAPAASHPTSGYDAYMYTDETITIPITRANSAFTHTVRFKLGSYTKTFTGVTTSVSWTPTTAEQNSLHSQMTTVMNRDGSIEVDTFYQGEQVRGTASRLLQFHIRNANPVFTGSITYADNNSTTITLTGNNQFIVQGKSLLNVTLSAASVSAQKGASISGFVFMVAGKSQTFPYTTNSITHTFGTVNASSNQTIVIEAVDSRGNRSSISKIVTVLPYSAPTLTTSAARINGFEADTILKASGTYSTLPVGGVPKNDVTNLRYRTREKNGAWSGWTSFSVGTSGKNFTGTDRTVIFDITKAYDVEFSVSDRLGSVVITKTVGVGRPIFFIDDALGSISMNDFPKDPNTFLLNGRLSFAGNIYAGSGEGEVGGAIDMNNSDIVRANGIYFNDISNNNGEGLLFMRGAGPAGSTDSSHYDNFYIRDGTFYLNNFEFLFTAPGDSAGQFVGLGSGGTTVVGGGESVKAWMDGSGVPTSNERLILANDSYVNIISNMQSGYSAGNIWTFNNDGIMYRPTYKEGNGFQTTTTRISPNHTDPMLIQTQAHSIALGGNASGYIDISYPVSFDAMPQALVATPQGGNSFGYAVSIYNITSSGCRIYLRHLNDSTSTLSISFYLVSIGRKG